MKILYRQPDLQTPPGSLAQFGASKFYLKQMWIDSDGVQLRKKEHHHTVFELHIVLEGGQSYSIGGQIWNITPGTYLLIPPRVPHQVLSTKDGTRRFTITFQKDDLEISDCQLGSLEAHIEDRLTFAQEEAAKQRETSGLLLENCLLEIIIQVLRASGMEEKYKSKRQEGHDALGLAKQYIEDNIDRAPEVETVAQYCYLSARQLTRLFQRVEGISPGEYIIHIRTARIEQLLQEEGRTLKQISEMMHFSSEYYFNSFCKKYIGMPPGAYRQMYGK